MEKSIIKLPRLYTELDLDQTKQAELTKEQAHYLKNVMRKGRGDQLRLFNGRDGEWLGVIQEISKKDIVIYLDKKIKDQPKFERRIHGFFSPIKKHRLDFLIEKSVELGITDLHPIITERTEVRKINEERMCAQIIEAVEQCERLDIPLLHSIKKLNTILSECEKPIYVALERFEGSMAKFEGKDDFKFMVGPEGGFSKAELKFLEAHKNVIPISLGGNILRAETAFIKILCKA